MKKPRPHGATEASWNVELAGDDTSEDTLRALHLQANLLADRFGLTPATARATAALAYRTEAPT